MLFRDKTIVPSIMFHSVGLESYPWVWSYVSESIDSFENKLKLLKHRSFNSIDWHQLYDYMSGNKLLPLNSIFLTFDDGYLDNWVYVYPLLKKYGFKGTIYVNPDFVDPRDIVRPNLDDVWMGHVDPEKLSIPGFLSWSEMRIMQESGVIDIQSHSLTHTWYYKGPNIIDYYRSASVQNFPWMAWNYRPDKKPYYLTEDQSSYVPTGTPIFEHEKSLIVNRFFPDAAAVNKLTVFINERVIKNGNKYNWKIILEQQIHTWYNGSVPGSYESNSERLERVHHELNESKNKIEHNLQKPVDFICWPGGGNDSNVWNIARDLGYKSWTLGSQDISTYRNRFQSTPEHIKRIGSSNTVYLLSNNCGKGGALYMLLKIGAHQNSLIYKLFLRLYQILKYIIK
ncbi:MAG: polysaccharide deacetylase family protein [Methylococcales bacterium]